METKFLNVFFLQVFAFLSSVLGEDYRYNVFKPKTTGMFISSHVLSQLLVRSEIECARACVLNSQCTAISYECQKMESLGKGTCFLNGAKNSTTSFVIKNDTTMCYFLLEQSQTEISTMTSVVSSSTGTPGLGMSLIIDLVEGIRNQCNSTSGSDIGIVTEDKIYFYDDANSLNKSPCKVVTDVHGFFPGFANLPPTMEWNAILTYQFTNVAVYANGDVYRWQTGGTTPLVKDNDYPKTLLNDVNGLLGITAISAPFDPIWGVYRNTSGSNMLYFYDAQDYINFYSDDSPYDTILQTTSTLTNLLGISVNPWGSLPDNVVGVALVNGKDFLLVTSSRGFYLLELDYNVLLNKPKTTLHYKGPIQFT